MKSFLGGQKTKKLTTYNNFRVNDFIVSKETSFRNKKRLWNKLMNEQNNKQKGVYMKTGWWSLTIQDYPNYEPNDIDLEHIAEMIKQGYHQGELIQEEDK